MRQKTSIATVCLSGDLAEKLSAIQKAGFDGIEIFEQDFIGFNRTAAETKKMVADYGLDITLFQPFRDFEGLPPGPLRERAFSRARYKFDLMNQLGTDLMLICSSTHPAALGGINRSADDLAELGEIAASCGVRVGFEALAWGRFINDHRDAWEVVRRANHPNIGLILDSFHTLVRGINPDSIRTIPADRIFFIQLADAPAIEMDYLYLSRHFRNMPGEGDLNINDFMQAVQATGYNGPISLEIFNDQFRRSDTELVAKDGYRSLVHLMDLVGRADNPPAANPLPPQVPVHCVAAIEFVLDAEYLSFYRSFFEASGFVCYGQHKSKNVLLFRQKDIIILLNMEPSYLLAQDGAKNGLMVSEIVFETEDAESALRRAVALGASQPVLPKAAQEATFPAINGTGKTIIRLVEPDTGIWQSDFNLTDEKRHNDGHLLNAIDHIAQTMSYDEMLSWTLFYTTIFEMQKWPLADVIDPDGLVKSQVVQSANKGTSLILNGSDGLRTRAADFISSSPGAAVQHIAFATDNIEQLAKALADAGGYILPQTSNYYQDVKARFDLDDAYIDFLKKQNILYDEDEKGVFLHFYCHLKHTNLFFEYVQRKGGYSGFGAANAPFRLSAQRRFRQTEKPS